MEIIEQFGLDTRLLIAQIINFIIILYLLKRFLYKPVFTVLENRQKTIKESLKQAEESRLLLEKAGEREKEMLKKAQEESKKLIEETRKQSGQIIAEAEALAKNQAQKILMEAKRQIELETKEARRSLTIALTGELVEGILQKSIAQMFDEGDQQKIIKKAIEQMKKRVN